MTIPAIAAIALLGLGLLPHEAGAATIEYLSQTRGASATDFSGDSGSSMPLTVSRSADDFEPFTASASVGSGSASVSSTLDPTSMAGSFSANAFGAASVGSAIVVGFRLGEASSFRLTGFAQTIAPSFGAASVRLSASDGTPIFDAPLSFDFAPFMETGLLAAGDYELSAGTGSGQGSFEFILTPEPNTAALLLIGLVALRAMGCSRNGLGAGSLRLSDQYGRSSRSTPT